MAGQGMKSEFRSQNSESPAFHVTQGGVDAAALPPQSMVVKGGFGSHIRVYRRGWKANAEGGMAGQGVTSEFRSQESEF